MKELGNNQKKIKLNVSEIDVYGSLGLLAHGDIAFREWRKVKKEAKAKEDEEK